MAKLPRRQARPSPLAATLAVLFAGSVAAPLARCEVIISEIMYNPQGTDVSAGFFNKEWVEIFNTGSSAVDLSGWTLADIEDGGGSTAIPGGVTLGPASALVLTPDAATFDAQWGAGIDRLELGDFPTLANSPSAANEILALRDAGGILRDVVNYDDEGAWPADNGSDGASIFAAPQGLSTAANDFGENWLPSMVGVYGGRFSEAGGLGENHASPGYVDVVPQGAFEPSPDAAWSLAVVPDTQNYVKFAANQPLLVQMTQWTADHRTTWGVQAVLHVGDIVNNNDATTPSSGDQTSVQQWQAARDAFARLDDQLPYMLTTGNHDHGLLNAENRETEFNVYFNASDNSLVDPDAGGALRGTMDAGQLQNAYYELTAPDGRELLVLTLEWGPRQQAVAWADRILSQSKFADHTAIVVTHAYMYHDETRYDWSRNLDGDPTNDQSGNPYSYGTADNTNDGEDLWQELIREHGNVAMVLSGHVGGDGTGYLVSTGVEGNEVHQLLFNTQFETNGGNGWIRVLEFLDDGRTVRVRTYSPYYDLQKTDAENSFVFQIAPLATPGDFDRDGDVDGADLSMWQESFGANAAADANGDGASDGGDFLIWQRFAAPAASAGAAETIPEPCALALSVSAATALASRRRRRRKTRS